MKERPQETENEIESGEERKMYPATCSECGAECEVPFEPEEGKPVKCKECYIKGRPKRNFGRRNFRREMHDATCSKCGKNCQVPFRPSGEKPILCKDCYLAEKK